MLLIFPFFFLFPVILFLFSLFILLFFFSFFFLLQNLEKIEAVGETESSSKK